MFLRKNIEFTIHSDLVNVKEIQPIPTKHCLPDWYKKVPKNNHTKGLTIKSCMPFLDSITAGYVLPLPQDFHVKWNYYNEELKENDCFFRYGLDGTIDSKKIHEYNLNSSVPQTHSTGQLGGENSFMTKKNGGFKFLKILNPWKIKTPPGYSCLFTSPYYNENDYFDIITGIVDTDKFDFWINFPIVINTDKYPTFEKTFSKGLPYVQVIPFKRDSWKINIDKMKTDTSVFYSYFSSFMDRYKNMFWTKKSWK